MFFTKSVNFPALFQFLRNIQRASPNIQMQFLLDPLALPEVDSLRQLYGQEVINHIYYLIRTHAYYLYRRKQILLGSWVGDNKQRSKNKEKNKSLIISGEANHLQRSSPVPHQRVRIAGEAHHHRQPDTAGQTWDRTIARQGVAGVSAGVLTHTARTDRQPSDVIL